MPKVSVLIPAYNVELYLPRCLDSILSQSFKDFEVILIDDGSSDATGKICDEYAQKDVRIKVFHQENQGISATRNLCLQYASGEYIQFVDSDDWIDVSALYTLVTEAEREKCDVVVFDFRIVSHNNDVVVSFPFEDIGEVRKIYISSLWAVLWKNLIRRDLFMHNNINFPEGIDGGEDYYVMSLVVLNARKIKYIPKILYNYNNENLHSTMHNIDIKKIQYQIESTKKLEKEMATLGIVKLYEKELLQREFFSKLPLLKERKLLWLKTFPKSSFFFYWCSPFKWIHIMKNMVRLILK